MVDDLGAPQSPHAVRCENGERRAPVRRVGLAAYQPLLFELDHDARDPTRGEHPPRSQIAHAQPSRRLGYERDQDAVVGEGDEALSLEAPVDLAHHRLAQADQAAPGKELLLAERIGLGQIVADV